MIWELPYLVGIGDFGGERNRAAELGKRTNIQLGSWSECKLDCQSLFKA